MGGWGHQQGLRIVRRSKGVWPIGVFIHLSLHRGNGIGFTEPMIQIDQLATLAAKGSKFKLSRFLASWAWHGGYFNLPAPPCLSLNQGEIFRMETIGLNGRERLGKILMLADSGLQNSGRDRLVGRG